MRFMSSGLNFLAIFCAYYYFNILTKEARFRMYYMYIYLTRYNITYHCVCATRIELSAWQCQTKVQL